MTESRSNLGMAALMSDAELVQRVLAGEQECYQFLVQRHQESLFRVAYSLVLDDDVAADLVQDAFVRAYVNLARCRDPDRFRVWLLATLRNRGLDYLKEKRRGDLSLDADDVARRAEALGTAAVSDDVERYAMRTALETALARLSEPLREAFVLRHVEQLSVEDTASVLGTSISAVKMRVHRAREQLQDWLGPDYGRGRTDVTDDRSRSSMK
ncbi:MAG TPA: sigma-70 family RNA polymerase sigma factor [Longimicrobiales bacterium]